MYDNNIYCPQYRDLKDTLVQKINGEDEKTDIEELADKIQEIYDNGNMSSTQYDDLMRYIQDLI